MINKKAPSQRQMMVAKVIQETISTSLLKDELFDFMIKGECISITEVTVSPDLHNATIFVNIREDITISSNDYLKTLNKNFSYKARNLIAKTLKTRYTPNIRFVLDQGLNKLQRLDAIFNNLAK